MCAVLRLLRSWSVDGRRLSAMSLLGSLDHLWVCWRLVRGERDQQLELAGRADRGWRAVDSRGWARQWSYCQHSHAPSHRPIRIVSQRLSLYHKHRLAGSELGMMSSRSPLVVADYSRTSCWPWPQTLWFQVLREIAAMVLCCQNWYFSNITCCQSHAVAYSVQRTIWSYIIWSCSFSLGSRLPQTIHNATLNNNEMTLWPGFLLLCRIYIPWLFPDFSRQNE